MYHFTLFTCLCAILTKLRKFKRPPVQNGTPAEFELSPVPKMIMNMSKIDYTYPSPSESKRSIKRSTPKTPSRVVVEVPRPPASFKRDNYVPTSSPKRQKLSDSGARGTVVLAVSSKKEKDDLLLNEFENQLVEIFEAQDRLVPDTSAIQVEIDTTIFHIPDDDDGDDTEPRLTISLQAKLQTIMSQLLSAGRLNDVSADYIQRFQRLLEPAIGGARMVNLRLQSDPSGEDITIWLSKLREIEIGAASACSLIYTVLGSSDNQDLVNLDVLQWLPNVLDNLFESCLIPIVEARPDGQDSVLFDIASAHTEHLKRLLDVGRKLLDLVARVCVEIKGTGSMVNPTEFLACKLIFVQNAYSDKASALGTQAYERLRKQAMATVAKLYATFPAEQPVILEEVLTSLDKLPSNSRSARQYKLGSGKSIQLVSALFMQLVQTAAMQTGKSERRKARRLPRHQPGTADASDDEDSANEIEVESGSVSDQMEKEPPSKGNQIAQRLFDGAFGSAQHIVSWMVDKASKVTKSGDSPYRNILDLFVEDLTVVLSSTDWPASELLLAVLALSMINRAKNDKAPASTKNMALESLGVMGAAISEARASARNLLASILRDGDSNSSKIAQNLSSLVKDHPHFLLPNEELIAPNGPFSIVHSYMTSLRGEGLRTRSAKAYFRVQYATLISRSLRTRSEGGQNYEMDLDLTATVSAMHQHLLNPEEYPEDMDEPLSVTQQEAQLAYMLSVLNMQFCRRFPLIAKTVASSLSSDQPQVRSRSLKSIVTILETDSSLLDWDPTIADDVFRCASNDSSLVRDSALSVIAKFIMPRPALEEKAFKQLLKCAMDVNVGVQKKAMGHLKDVYLKESRMNMKATIAIEFLRRTADPEISVAELAKKTLAEIWISPNLVLGDRESESAQADVAIENLTAHIVACVGSDAAALSPLLQDFLVWKLKDSKNVDQVQALCTRIVKKLLDIANSSGAGPADLTTLVAFAEARPQTIVPADLTSLKSYLKNLTKSDDLLKFTSVVAIFRRVLPQLSSAHSILLQEVQLDLMKAAQNLVRRHELEQVMSCLGSIDGVLHNTNRLVSFTISIMHNVIKPKVSVDPKENSQQAIEARQNRIRLASLRLAGAVAKHINLENHRREFQAQFPSFKSGSVAGFIADSIVPLTFKKYPVEIRVKALDSLGLICQARPGLFNRTHVRETFFEVLDASGKTSVSESEIRRMQMTVLETFEELYARRVSVKDDTSKAADESEVQALKIIGGDSKTREDDSAISIITNPLVDHLLQIVMLETGDKALVAAKTLASIDHQGMTHPKQSTAAFVALETSSDIRVSKVARIAHEHLHQQHESVCEREYVHAVFEAFRYQNEVFHDPRGGVVPGFKAKLGPAFSIISSSGSKYVKKFLSNLITKLNTEYTKLNMDDEESPRHMLFVLFVTQNLAFFEYKKMDELLHTVLQLELVFGKSGSETAQAIEIHVLSALSQTADKVEAVDSIPPATIPMDQPIDAAMLKRLTIAACAITLISEARDFLKRQYGISRDVKMAMQHHKQAKESTREPVKVHGITGDRFWNSTNAILGSLDSQETMIARCREFVRVVAEDGEVKIAEEEGEMHAVDRLSEPPMSAQRGKKRKSINGSIGGTPKKARGRPGRNANGRRSTSMSSADDPDGDFMG